MQKLSDYARRNFGSLLEHEKHGDAIVELLKAPDHPEWVDWAAKRMLTPWIPDRFAFAFNDPKVYGDGTSLNVFGKLLKELQSPEGLSEGQLLTLVNAFTAKCTEVEWKNLCQPILQRTFSYGTLELSTFFQYRHSYTNIHLWPETKTIASLPFEDGYYYDHNTEAHRLYIVVTKEYVNILDRDGADNFSFHFDGSVFHKAFSNLEGVTYPLIFESYYDEGLLALTDVYTLADMNTASGEYRRVFLEHAYTILDDTAREMGFRIEVDDIILGEAYEGTANDWKAAREYFKGMYSPPRDDDVRNLLYKPRSKPYNYTRIIVPVYKNGIESIAEPTISNTTKLKRIEK